MEFLSVKISISPQLSTPVPFVSWKTTRISSSLTIPKSKRFPLQPSFPLYLFSPVSTKKFRISAHSRRPSRRHNYLRKKLTRQQLHQQVSENLAQEIDKVDAYQSNFDNSSDFERSSSLNDESLGSTNVYANFSRNEGVRDSVKKFGESIMWNKLESWVEQYKKDSQFWGIGTVPIFTVFQDGEDKVERVVVNEDEIVRRSRIDSQLDNETELSAEVDFKISFAKDLAREMENGSNVIPKNSSVAKFLQSGAEELRVTESHLPVTVKPVSFPNNSRVGVLVLCGFCVIWAIKRLLAVRNNSKGEYTPFEREMLRRKIKARKEEEKMVKGSVEVMQEVVEPKGVSFKKPQLDKKELYSSIVKAKGSNNRLAIVNHVGFQPATSEKNELESKIEEIRAMARDVRESERRDALQKSSSQNETSENELSSDEEVDDEDSGETKEYVSVVDRKDGIGLSIDGSSDEKSEARFHNVPSGTRSLSSEVSNEKEVPAHSDLAEEEALHSDDPGWQSRQHKNPSGKKFRIIKSAKEAREYLSRKNQTLEVNQKDNGNNEHGGTSNLVPSANVASGNTSQRMDLTEKVHASPLMSGIDDFSCRLEEYSWGCKTAEENMDSIKHSETSRISSGAEVSISNKVTGIPVHEIPKEETDIWSGQAFNSNSDTSSFLGDMHQLQTEKVPCPLQTHKSEDTTENDSSVVGLQESALTTDNEVKDVSKELPPSASKENWMEKNFHEFGPIVDKIKVGFRDSYQLAKEKASQESGSETDLAQLTSDAESELEWMKDERLREIVLKVRDNELSGRDPFHLMDENDKLAFFNGLEKKIEQENKRLLKLHEYLHSNIENLDYGADGISLYDPPEKIIPRWKVPPTERNPEFLNNVVEQRKEDVAEILKNSFLSRENVDESVVKSEELSFLANDAVAADDSDSRTDNIISSKTIIEGSDGSLRAGKKSGKEFWQHTKKWSEGFLESYNAETDPETKAVMRDIGKDLDRWITEREIKEATELMEKLPEKTFIKQKLNKVRREMELYGPQAVVSKYREYAEEKEEDHLWWLDLPHILCIELYTVEDGEERVGFYSLEMAADLELDPKPYHVIAFEDAGDCKNLCYIIQSKMEMLGNGNAFIVARPPKDAFREAKTNGFSVTVIRKGELQLNVDQTLEEVEEVIAEIGSKIYHDSITRERSIDVNGLMKGVFGITKPTKRKRTKRKKSKRRI